MYDDDPTRDPLDPLAPRPDDPRIGRWWRLLGPSARKGSPLATLAVVTIVVASGAFVVILLNRYGVL